MRARSVLLLCTGIALVLVAVGPWWDGEPPPAPSSGGEDRSGADSVDRGPGPLLERSTTADTPAEGPREGELLRVLGRVTDERTGTAIGGARVAVFPGSTGRTRLREAEPLAATTSDARGDYELGLVAEQPPYQYASATAPGYLPAVRLLHDGLVERSVVAGFDFALVPEVEAASVRGIVRDPHGRPLPADASLQNEKGRWSGWLETRGSELEVACDARGTFVLRGAAPGNHLLSVRCEGHRPWTKNLDLQAASDTDVGVVTLTPLAEGEEPDATFVGSIAGPDGAPIPDAEIAVRERSTREHVTHTDAGGRFETRVPAGEHHVVLRPTGRPVVRLPLEFPAGEVVTWHYRYPVGDHFLGGVVVSMADGRPLPGIGVEARVQDTGRSPDLLVNGATDDEGRFRLAGLPDGATSLLLEWENPYTDLYVEEIAVDRDDHRFAFPFPELVLVHGTVRDAGGVPLAGVRVATARMEGEGTRAVSGADGRYDLEVPMTSQQSQRFSAELNGYLTVTAHFLREHGGVDAAIVWDPVLVAEDELGTVRGRVTGARGQPLAGVRVGIFPHDGERTVARAFAETDSDGEYRLAGVLPGDLELQFVAAGHHELVLNAELDPRGTLQRDVSLETVVESDLQYLLVDEDGIAVSGVAWQAWSYHPRRSEEGVTGGDGRIVLRGWPLATGRIDLETPAGFPNHMVWLERRERAPLPQRLVLRRGDLQVRGRVLDARGGPAPRVGVILSDERRDGVQVREYAYTGADGRFTFGQLAPGEYLCEVDSYAQSDAMARAGGPPVELRRGW